VIIFNPREKQAIENMANAMQSTLHQSFPMEQVSLGIMAQIILIDVSLRRVEVIASEPELISDLRAILRGVIRGTGIDYIESRIN
jgi:hypothetical protein